MIELTSLQNPRIKQLAKLTTRRKRDQLRQTVVEGAREIRRALDSGIIPHEAYVCPSLLNSPDAEQAFAQLSALQRQHPFTFFSVTPEIFAKVAYRSTSDGLLVVIDYLSNQLEALPVTPLPFLVVVEGVEKPGNLGAILRTADAAGVDALLVCAGATDIHNPNVIRASLGTSFTVPTMEESADVIVNWLSRHHISIIAATPHAATCYTDVDMAGPVAIVMGSEADGLSEYWLEHADRQVVIPMHGMADSLNLATSTALLLYEVVRQRNL